MTDNPVVKEFHKLAYEGMTLRDYFAAKAMQGMAARDTFDAGQATPEKASTDCFDGSDACSC